MQNYLKLIANACDVFRYFSTLSSNFRTLAKSNRNELKNRYNNIKSVFIIFHPLFLYSNFENRVKIKQSVEFKLEFPIIYQSFLKAV